MADLPTVTFLRLRQRFFDSGGRPIPFRLRDKRNTQDDPLDEFLAVNVLTQLEDVTCIRAPGPLIAPDFVLYRDTHISRADDLNQIVGIEVKKIERTPQGAVARATGLDFNTTPPCGTIRVYDAATRPIDIRGFYLFVCLEHLPRPPRQAILSALAVVDGNILNDDFSLYLSITGERTKRIGLGTFSDGVDRARPMLIFANPLGVPELGHGASMIHADRALAASISDLTLAFVLKRSVAEGAFHTYYCYRHSRDGNDPIRELVDPFPTPLRDTRTRPRGRFTLPFTL